MLYIVSTPLGNIKDITLRAIETLRDADLILAEDTRRIRKLLSHYGISLSGKKLYSLNENNIKNKPPSLLPIIKAQKVELVSDNGTPTISDPGYFLVNACVEEGIQPVSVPGACALISALSVSGLPSDKFVFFGFFPKKEKKRVEI